MDYLRLVDSRLVALVVAFSHKRGLCLAHGTHAAVSPTESLGERMQAGGGSLAIHHAG